MHKHKGFTILELTIAMVVMVILLTIGVVSYRSSLAHARDREREVDVQTIAEYLENIYPQEIRNSSGSVIKKAGAYPILPSEIDESTTYLETIFSDLNPSAMTPPGVSLRKTPNLGAHGSYVPGNSVSNCSIYYLCYSRPNDVAGSKDAYVYIPGPEANDVCTTHAGVSDCRRYVIIYRKEVGNERVVVESRRR